MVSRGAGVPRAMLYAIMCCADDSEIDSDIDGEADKRIDSEIDREVDN